jgi:hypothetical protein
VINGQEAVYFALSEILLEQEFFQAYMRSEHLDDQVKDVLVVAGFMPPMRFDGLLKVTRNF